MSAPLSGVLRVLLAFGVCAGVVACGDRADPVDDEVSGAQTLPTRPRADRDVPEALVAGTLVLDDLGCVRVLAAGGRSHLVVWPKGTTLSGDAVVTPDGRSVAMGGGLSGAGAYTKAGRLAATDERLRSSLEACGVAPDDEVASLVRLGR